MTAYQFRAVGFDNRVQAGEIDAVDLTAASRTLIDRGLYPIEISSQAKARISLFDRAGSKRMSANEVAQFLADLSHLLGAGVEVAEAVSIILATYTAKHTKSAVADVLNALRRGTPLSEAIADLGRACPPHAAAVIKAGEASGALATALSHVSLGIGQALSLRKQVQTALIYPACIAAAATLAVLVLLLFVVPTLESLFSDAMNRLPWQTTLLITISQGLRQHAAILLPGITVVAISVMLSFRIPSTRTILERMILRLPGVGPLLCAAETARIARLLAILAASYMPLVAALNLTRSAAILELSRSQLDTAVLELREGAALSQVVAKMPTLSPRFTALVGIGESTGQLPEMLAEAARGAEQKVAVSVERLLALLTPALTVLFGAVAAFVLYAVMTAILSVNDLAAIGR